MRLQRIRIEQLRQFRQPFELDGLDAGLNLLAGPNEAGKSTLVRAIRAAFFERHRSTSVDDLLPWGEPSAAPAVEIDFTIDGVPHRLRKRFLHRKRCLLEIDRRQLEGEEAEQTLADLLGFGFAAKGASKPEHQGIPGLLWIEQGQAQEIDEAVGHASTRLHQALAPALSEIASAQGDALIAQVRKERNLLLTEQGGKPRGALQEALATQEALTSRMAELDARITRYQQQVDQLGELLREHAQEAAERPWDALRSQQQQAAQQVAALQAQAAGLDADRDRLRQLGATQASLQLHVERFEADTAGLARRQQERERALQLRGEAAAALARWQEERAAAERACQDADALLQRAQQAQRHADLLREQREAGSSATAVQATLELALQDERQLVRLRERAAMAPAPSPQDVDQLRQQQQQLDALRVRQQAVATRLQYELQADAALTLDGRPLAGQGELLIDRASELGLGVLGRLRIIPGGVDLAQLARDEATLAAAHAALLQQLGARDLADAHARQAAAAQLQRDIELAERTLALRAPQGLEALRAQCAALVLRGERAAAALAQLPAPSGSPTAGGTALGDAQAQDAPSLGDVQAQLASARGRLQQVTRQFDQANLASANATAQHDAAMRECTALQASLDDPQRRALAQSQHEQLRATAAQVQALTRSIAERQGALAQARGDILAQDVERLGRSAQQAQQRHDERATTIRVLQCTLEDAGAHGLEEERSLGHLALQAAQRRVQELQLRAQALDLLQERLLAHRQASTLRLQAPLRKHLQHYLQLLFPLAQLDLDERLAPTQLTRAAPQGTQRDPIAALSYGARGQMGVISRLAYADLLQEAGRPTLIILDDALVHSDAHRLAQMKRVLFDAARKHQVLLFTCHPELWRDLGAAPRAIGVAPT